MTTENLQHFIDLASNTLQELMDQDIIQTKPDATGQPLTITSPQIIDIVTKDAEAIVTGLIDQLEPI